MASGLDVIEAVPLSEPLLSGSPATQGVGSRGLLWEPQKLVVLSEHHRLCGGLFYPRPTRITQAVSCSPPESEERVW